MFQYVYNITCILKLIYVLYMYSKIDLCLIKNNYIALLRHFRINLE